MRLLLAVLLWVAVVGPSRWPGIAVQKALSAGRHPDGHYLIMDSIGLLPHLIPVAVLLVVLPRVAYRRRDALVYLIPVFGWFFFCKVCWRLAGLPHPDWPERRTAT